MDNFMKLTVKAIAQNEVFVRNTIAAFCAESNPSVDVVADVKTAVSEAISNCVVHAYDGKGDGQIEINAQIIDDILHISITDFGCGIDDIDKAMEPHFTTAEEKERSGIGFTIMSTFMDELNVISTKTGGTTVKMSKKLI